MIGTKNYDFILDRLAVGGYTARSNPEWAAVVTVVSPEELANFSEYFPLSERMPWIHIPLSDGRKGLKPHLDAVTSFIQTHIRNGCVLVHCGAGNSRSVSIVVAYLVLCGFSMQDALSFVRQHRPGICPYSGFLDEIKQHFQLHLLYEKGPRIK
jgi:protein-tyrosine phosphatase